MRHLRRADVFIDDRFKLHHKRQIHKFDKQIRSNRLVKVAKLLNALIGFPCNIYLHIYKCMYLCMCIYQKVTTSLCWYSEFHA